MKTNPQPLHKCQWCGVLFRRKTADGTRIIGSTHMPVLDPSGHFHSMRCAVLYAVRAATNKPHTDALCSQASEKLDEYRRELESLRAFKKSVDEALNSGDGVYRP